MDIMITDMSGVTKAELSGRLDTLNVDALESQFNAGIVPKAQNTVVDLTNVSFIASLGLRMFLSAYHGLSKTGAKFAMFGASPALMEILESVALLDVIPVCATEADAIAEVNRPNS